MMLFRPHSSPFMSSNDVFLQAKCTSHPPPKRRGEKAANLKHTSQCAGWTRWTFQTLRSYGISYVTSRFVVINFLQKMREI